MSLSSNPAHGNSGCVLPTKTLNERCPICRTQPLRQIEFQRPDGTTATITLACKCQEEQWDKEKREFEFKQELTKLSKTFPDLRPQHLQTFRREYGFDKFKRRPGTEDAFDWAQEFVKQYINNRLRRGGLILGPCGGGKTHLLFSIMMALMDNMTLCVYTTAELLRKATEPYYAGQNIRQEMAEYGAVFMRACSAPVLILDEIGGEVADRRWFAALQTLLDYRGALKKPICGASNLSSINTLSSFYTDPKTGEAPCASRMLQYMTLLPVTPPFDYRQVKAGLLSPDGAPT